MLKSFSLHENLFLKENIEIISFFHILLSFQDASFSHSSLYVECLKESINVNETHTVNSLNKNTCIQKVSQVTKMEGERLFLSVK